DEMLRQAIKYAPKADYVIGCAAVADFTPEKRVNKKIPRDRQTREVSLKVTEDILSALTSRRRKGQYFAGFSLENGFDLLRAREKMSRKGLDMIILNPVSSMERETASAWILKGRAVRRFHNVSKKVLAREIWNEILNK
ncbi:MAG TPA: phosphopantothenoylcysteine decarboxylase, partial [bacterium]|nr:phosphopantothenoylcysteine decarboxylase [bacterium]